jgi:hypothetical protein
MTMLPLGWNSIELRGRRAWSTRRIVPQGTIYKGGGWTDRGLDTTRNLGAEEHTRRQGADFHRVRDHNPYWSSNHTTAL